MHIFPNLSDFQGLLMDYKECEQRTIEKLKKLALKLPSQYGGIKYWTIKVN